MPLILVGHSHIRALSKGAVIAGRSVVEFPLREFGKSTNRVLQADIGKNLVSAVHEHSANRVFCLIGGSLYAAMGMVQHPVRFDFVMPDRPDLPFDKQASIIPFDVLQTLMTRKLRRHFQLLAQLAKTVPAKLTQLEPPPPTSDGAFPEKGGYRFASAVEKSGISGQYLRYKIWRLHNNVYRRFCAKANIDYVSNPPDVFDNDGFLAERYRGDFVHGNGQYGALILENLEKISRE